MTGVSKKGQITRRGFFERGVGAVAAIGALVNVNTAGAAYDPGVKADVVKADSVPTPGKIALEEHFDFAETEKLSYAALGSPEFRRQIADMGSGRIAEMDRGGVEICILSLVGPGIQAIPNTSQAISIARSANDHLAEQIQKNPKRLRGFAALPMQDPKVAAQELTRCVKELGFCGAMVNGFTQTGEGDSIAFYDMPQYRDFWATVQQLDVPFYLHPRSPLTEHDPAYGGHPWLNSSVWGFAAESSIHALRLMGSGLFDDCPKLKLILGHLGEGLPCNIWRIDNRVSRTLAARPKAKLPIGHYLRENFYITTSGNFRTQTLTEVMLEVGPDHILYSVDYPFEDMGIATEWFDHAAIGEADRFKIGRSNASALFHL
jgi:predicted TIM-barrel fold metal-dependent hydrolase